MNTKRFILKADDASSIAERVATYVVGVANRYGLNFADDWTPRLQWCEDKETLKVLHIFSVDGALAFHCLLSILCIRPKLNITVNGGNALGPVADIHIPRHLIPELTEPASCK